MADNYSIYCPNCHKQTSITTRVNYQWPRDRSYSYEVAECNGCDFFLLVKRHGQQIQQVYPSPLPKAVDEKIPEKISKDFAEALLCLSIGANRGAAVLARRAVQTICLDKLDKDSKSSKLKDQIDELFTKNIITEDLKGWAHEVRFVGNDAAHPGDQEVEKTDAEEILDLLESFCEVLYVAPAKAESRRKIREERKLAKP